MSTAEVSRRIILSITAAILLFAVLSYIGVPSSIPDTLPSRLRDAEFWEMVTNFSEAGGYFRSDNFVSNEVGYQEVIPALRRTIRPGGAYLGVGPEQNFTYIVGIEPKIAFIVDIRRQNMIEHLLYKALMELSPDRKEFLSRLFSRPAPSSIGRESSPQSLVRAFQESRPSEEQLEASLKSVLEYLENSKGFGLSAEDEASMHYVYRAFYDSGANLRFTFVGGGGGFMMMPTYGELMSETDGRNRNWNFLGSDENYQKVRRMQQRNLIVPLVGNFAGPHAIRSVADYLRAHDAVLSTFYTSNVEQYLFQDASDWMRFYSNVSTLPVNSSSMFIRYVVGWRFRLGSRSRVSSIEDIVRANDRGRIRGYFDVIDMSW